MIISFKIDYYRTVYLNVILILIIIHFVDISIKVQFAMLESEVRVRLRVIICAVITLIVCCVVASDRFVLFVSVVFCFLSGY